MLSPAKYRAFAASALEDAAEYRIEAVTADEPRRSMLLKWAANREADAEHYETQAYYSETHERRRAPKQEAA